MRLLNTQTLQLESFADNAVPTYAILSHVWGPEQDEVSFEDMKTSAGEQRTGYSKLKMSSAAAAMRGLKYIWIDTCCIDKSSSAELSEAINSMFRFYSGASVCYAYLADVSSTDDGGDFHESKWFTRGWTLQELIAPKELIFLSKNWNPLGTKAEFAPTIAQITKVDVRTLRDSNHLSNASVAKRMSWASNRTTTREEDIAYCLLGIFDVNMPLLYGEGEKAFLRFQEELMKRSTDQSLFAWTPSRRRTCFNLGILARHPEDFAHASKIVSYGVDNPYVMTNMGLQITLPTIQVDQRIKILVVVLACYFEGNFQGSVGIRLLNNGTIPGMYRRTHRQPEFVDESSRAKAQARALYITNQENQTSQKTSYAWVREMPHEKYGFQPFEFSNGPWNNFERTLILSDLPVEAQRGSIILKHPLHPSCKIEFGERDHPLSKFGGTPYVKISLQSQMGEYEMNQQHVYLPYSANARANVSPSRSIMAKSRWEVIMNQRVLIVEITARDDLTKEYWLLISSAISQTPIFLALWLSRQTSLLSNWRPRVSSHLLSRRGHYFVIAVSLWICLSPLANFSSCYESLLEVGMDGQTFWNPWIISWFRYMAHERGTKGDFELSKCLPEVCICIRAITIRFLLWCLVLCFNHALFTTNDGRGGIIIDMLFGYVSIFYIDELGVLQGFLHMIGAAIVFSFYTYYRIFSKLKM